MLPLWLAFLLASLALVIIPTGAVCLSRVHQRKRASYVPLRKA